MNELVQFRSKFWLWKMFYESVDDRILSKAISRKFYGKNNSGHRGLTCSKYGTCSETHLFVLKSSKWSFIAVTEWLKKQCLSHDQLKIRPHFLPWVSKNRRYRILNGIDRIGDFLKTIECRSLKFGRRI